MNRCIGKRKYRTFELADVEVQRIAQKRARMPDDHKPPISAYFCDNCGFFHLGHTPNLAARRREPIRRAHRAEKNIIIREFLMILWEKYQQEQPQQLTENKLG